MAAMTITEGLAELKTIQARINKKRQNLLPYVAHESKFRDPMENKGGSAEFIRAERQSIEDLEKRFVAIRTSIQKKNLEVQLTVAGIVRTVAEWLTWKREIAEGQNMFLSQISSSIGVVRQRVTGGANRALAAVAANASVSTGSEPASQVTVHVDEKVLYSEQEQMATILGELDGKLSLFNATQSIDVA